MMKSQSKRAAMSRVAGASLVIGGAALTAVLLSAGPGQSITATGGNTIGNTSGNTFLENSIGQHGWSELRGTTSTPSPGSPG